MGSSDLDAVLKVLDVRGVDVVSRSVAPRAVLDVNAALDATLPIIEAVRDRGAVALSELARRFDGVEPPSLRVPLAIRDDSLERLDPALYVALEETIKRVRTVHRGQRRQEQTTHLAVGATVTERWMPVDRVGLYVPGGRAAYFTSVVMNVVAAQEAGVPSLAIASPPQADNGGWPHPYILAAAAMLGIDEIFAVGGAQAIAMFAYGVRDEDGAWLCAPAAMVTGPGNIYVAAAKRALRGVVGIDSEAGPTEVMILADDSANPEWVAADLISQAEHDIIAASVLVTPSEGLARSVNEAVERQLSHAKHAARVREALGGPQSAILIVDDLDAGLAVVNDYAAEHLEIQTRNAATVARRVRNAGAIFVGPHAPVSLGDYCAGSNHILPTGGSARYSSGLSVQSFLRGIHLVEYDAGALREVEPFLTTLANAEDLPAHGAAARIRTGG